MHIYVLEITHSDRAWTLHRFGSCRTWNVCTCGLLLLIFAICIRIIDEQALAPVVIINNNTPGLSKILWYRQDNIRNKLWGGVTPNMSSTDRWGLV